MIETKNKSPIKIETIENDPVESLASSPKTGSTLPDQIRASDVSRKRARNQYDFVSNQKEVNRRKKGFPLLIVRAKKKDSYIFQLKSNRFSSGSSCLFSILSTVI